MASFGYQPPLFEFQEEEVALPSLQANLRHCKVWGWVSSALLHSSSQYQKQANHDHVPAPSYLLGQRVWLSSRDLPLQVDSQKLTPRFVGPFVIDRIINPSPGSPQVPSFT